MWVPSAHLSLGTPSICVILGGEELQISAAHSPRILRDSVCVVHGVAGSLMKLRDWSFLRFNRDEAEPTPVKADRLRVMNVTRGIELAREAEVARSGGKRSKGLLGRKGLARGEGLWIVPCEAIHTFFMQFDIDLIYLDRKLRIKKVASGVSPWRMSACLSAHSVLELPSGVVHETQSRAGDFVEFTPIPESTDSIKH